MPELKKVETSRKAADARKSGELGKESELRKNGARVPDSERLGLELRKVNTRITQQTEWMRGLSNDLRRLSDRIYGLTEGRVTVADVKLPLGRYRTPDQTQVDSAEFAEAADRLTQVRRRFVSLEREFVAADELRNQLDRVAARNLTRRKAS